MTSVKFKYEIHQDVLIEPLELPGKIFARCDRGNNVRDYRIVWWANGKRNDEWLYEHELEPQRKK